MDIQKELVRKKVSDLIPYKKNPRTIPQEAIDDVCESYRQCGVIDPIEIDEKNVILSGHTRRLAALQLEIEEVDCLLVKGLTSAQKRKYRILANKTGERTGWDYELLAEEIEDLDFEGYDFEFDIPELDVSFSKDEFEKADDYEPTIPEEPKSKRGYIYQLGKHRLMCGDSTDEEEVLMLMNDRRAKMVFTDPPWNVNYGSEEEGNPMGYKPRTILNDFMGTEEFKNFMDSAFHCMNVASESGAMTYVVMSAQEWGNMMLTLAGNDYHWSSTIIWNKDRLVLSRKDYHTKYEPIWYGWKSGEARLHPLEDRKQSDVWDFDRPKVSVEHPTMKPVELVAQAITNSSNAGDLVLDLFGGSGTTLIACEMLKRECCMMELDPHYVDVIIDRWEQFTGGQAVLLNG